MIWESMDHPAEERAAALVAAVQGRRELKRLSHWMELHADKPLWAALWQVVANRGVADLEEARTWPAKKLLRRAQDREQTSRVRTNPIARDEAFVCMFCKKEVPPHGRTARDHCPWCLRSRHVDVVPGDRASTCGGRLDPYEVQMSGHDVIIRYACTRCDHQHDVRAVLDGEPPDDWAALVPLSPGLLA